VVWGVLSGVPHAGPSAPPTDHKTDQNGPLGPGGWKSATCYMRYGCGITRPNRISCENPVWSGSTVGLLPRRPKMLYYKSPVPLVGSIWATQPDRIVCQGPAALLLALLVASIPKSAVSVLSGGNTRKPPSGPPGESGEAHRCGSVLTKNG